MPFTRFHFSTFVLYLVAISLVNLDGAVHDSIFSSVMSSNFKLPTQFSMDTRNVPRASRSLIPLPSQPVQFATVAPPTGTAGSVTTPGLPAGLALHATNQSSLREIPEANSTWGDAPRVDLVAMDVRLARVRAQVNILSASAGPSPARNGSDAPLQPSPFEPLEVYQICSMNNAPNSVQGGMMRADHWAPAATGPGYGPLDHRNEQFLLEAVPV